MTFLFSHLGSCICEVFVAVDSFKSSKNESNSEPYSISVGIHRSPFTDVISCSFSAVVYSISIDEFEN